MKHHYLRFARYNQWANQRLYGVAGTLAGELLWADRGAFFGSLMGTLNHILVADILWMARFAGETPPVIVLDGVLHRDLPSLSGAREAMDLRLLDFIDGLDDARLAGTIGYANTRGDRFVQPLELLLAHLFNHQTHHRGQAHGLLSQLGAEPPPLDLIYFSRLAQ